MTNHNPFVHINWDKWRRQDGTIRVTDIMLSVNTNRHGIGVHYLRDIEQTQPIKSRQVAAMMLINAATFEAFAQYMTSSVSDRLLDLMKNSVPKH